MENKAQVAGHYLEFGRFVRIRIRPVTQFFQSFGEVEPAANMEVGFNPFRLDSLYRAPCIFPFCGGGLKYLIAHFKREFFWCVYWTFQGALRQIPTAGFEGFLQDLWTQ